MMPQPLAALVAYLSPCTASFILVVSVPSELRATLPLLHGNGSPTSRIRALSKWPTIHSLSFRRVACALLFFSAWSDFLTQRDSFTKASGGWESGRLRGGGKRSDWRAPRSWLPSPRLWVCCHRAPGRVARLPWVQFPHRPLS